MRLLASIATSAFAGVMACSLTIDTTGYANGEDPPGTVGDGGAGGPTTPDGTPSETGTTLTRPNVLLASGAKHACVVVDGIARCWGDNGAGQLGDGTRTRRLSPVAVVGLPGKVSAIGAGDWHTCAVVEGKIYCWGDNDQGCLGKGVDGGSTSTPTLVPDVANATSVSGGNSYTCAAADSRAYCWGANYNGQLGDGSVTPSGHSAASAVVNEGGIMTNVAHVHAGGDHACLLTTTGGVHCWGHNDNGVALGNPGAEERSGRAIPVVGLPGASSTFFIAGWHGCAVVNGAAWCWGRNDNGELGNGKRDNSSTPTRVLELDGVTVLNGSGGNDDSDATCAFHGTSLSCWGVGKLGRLGNGSATTTDKPMKVNATSFPQGNVVALAGGHLHSCAAFANGSVRCWGAGSAGQLGDGRGQDSFTPVAVSE